jgi:hypothetical protein
MALQDILDRTFGLESDANARMSSMPTIRPVGPPPQSPTPSAPAQANGGLESLLPMLLAAKQGGGGGGGGQGSGNIDPSLDLMTRRGVTLDEDALRSLLQARRAGFNAFPFIGSDYRSYQEQADLFANRAGRSIPVAPPGQSLHQQGLAFDSGSLPSDIRRYLVNHGWFWGNSFGDPVHYSYGQSG